MLWNCVDSFCLFADGKERQIGRRCFIESGASWKHNALMDVPYMNMQISPHKQNGASSFWEFLDTCTNSGLMCCYICVISGIFSCIVLKA